MRLLKTITAGGLPHYVHLNKGGKSSPPPTPTVAPTPAVEEASLEIEDEDKKKKLETSKGTLKVPLTQTKDTGLKI